MRNAMVSARDTMIADFPKDANGWLLYQQMNANGTLTLRNFTGAALAPAVALIDAVISSIQ
jgi:hypothetical protein